MIAEPKSIVGMSFIKETDEFFATGTVVGRTDDGLYMVAYDIDEAPQRGVEVVSKEQLVNHCLECGDGRFSFFANRADLDKYVDWLITPSPEDTKPKAPVDELDAARRRRAKLEETS